MTIDECKTRLAKLAAVDERDGMWHVTADVKKLRAVLETLCPVFDYPEDLTCVDDGAALTVCYQLYALADAQALRLTTTVARTGGRVPTASDLWRGFEWHEREAYDLFGVVFEGHPDLRRILTWEGFQGHPLLKDFTVDNEDSSWRIPEQTDADIVNLLEQA